MSHDSCNSAFMTYERISSWWTCFSPLLKNSQLFKNCNMNLRLCDTWQWVPHGELGPLLYQGGGAGAGGPNALKYQNPRFPSSALLLLGITAILTVFLFCYCIQFLWSKPSNHFVSDSVANGQWPFMYNALLQNIFTVSNMLRSVLLEHCIQYY